MFFAILLGLDTKLLRFCVLFLYPLLLYLLAVFVDNHHLHINSQGPLLGVLHHHRFIDHKHLEIAAALPYPQCLAILVSFQVKLVADGADAVISPYLPVVIGNEPLFVNVHDIHQVAVIHQLHKASVTH